MSDRTIKLQRGSSRSPATVGNESSAKHELDPANATSEAFVPPAPETSSQDRSRVSNKGTPVANVVSVRSQLPAASELFSRLKNAVLRSQHPERANALRALEVLVQAADGLLIAAALLLHRRREQITTADLEHFPKSNNIDAEGLIERLAFWRKLPRAAEAMAGMPEPLYGMLASAFSACKDPAITERAIAYIQTTRAGRSTWMIKGFLAAVGELAPGGEKLVDGARALARLARRQEALELEVHGALPKLEDRLLDDPMAVDAFHTALVDGEVRVHPVVAKPIAGLDDPAASELAGSGLGIERGNRRGALAELLRLWQVQHDPKDAGKVLIRGLRLLNAPPGLRTARSAEEAIRWCRSVQPPVDESHLFRVATANGAFYALCRTEVDLAVFEPKGDKLGLVRIENVKAGLGSPQEARSQNRVALEALSDRDTVCVLYGPQGGVCRDIRDLLDLSAETIDKVVSVTVGPSDDPHYDLALPLTGWDISQLALRL